MIKEDDASCQHSQMCHWNDRNCNCTFYPLGCGIVK